MIGLLGGYILSIILTLTGVCPGLVDFQPIADASIISPFWKIGEFFTLPEFNLEAVALLAPIAFVTFMEHIGDVTTNGSVVGKDFLEDPGLHRTLIGDGLATMAAGLLLSLIHICTKNYGFEKEVRRYLDESGLETWKIYKLSIDNLGTRVVLE